MTTSGPEAEQGAPRFGVVVPATGPVTHPRAFGEVIDACDALGYDGVWFGDHVAVPSYAAAFTDPGWIEPLSGCLLALGRSRRLRAGTDVLVVPYRNPLVVAKMAATAHALSGGRLVLATGVGYLRGEFGALGADYARRGAVTDEYLGVIRTLWRSGGRPTSFAGRFVSFDQVCLGPSADALAVPLWVGGNAPPALRRAAALGDGWHPLFPTPEAYRRGRERIDALREPGPFTWSISLAATRVLGAGESYAPTSWADVSDVPADFGYAPPMPTDPDGRPRFVGDADEVAADVTEYVAAGVEHFTLRFSTGGAGSSVADYLAQLERFACEVMGRFPAPAPDPPGRPVGQRSPKRAS